MQNPPRHIFKYFTSGVPNWRLFFRKHFSIIKLESSKSPPPPPHLSFSQQQLHATSPTHLPHPPRSKFKSCLCQYQFVVVLLFFLSSQWQTLTISHLWPIVTFAASTNFYFFHTPPPHPPSNLHSQESSSGFVHSCYLYICLTFP